MTPSKISFWATGISALFSLFLLPNAHADFTSDCSTYGFYAIENYYVVQIQDSSTGEVSPDCQASDWEMTGNAQGFGPMQKSAEDVKFLRKSGGFINVRAMNAAGEYTADNYLNIEPAEGSASTGPSGNTTGSTESTSNEKKDVYLKISNLQYTGLDSRDPNYGNGTMKQAMLISLMAQNTGKDAFDLTETDPLNPDSDHTKYPYVGVVSCGNALGPVTTQYEGRIEYPTIPGGGSVSAEMLIFDGQELSNELLEGYVVPCSTQNLEGLYENIAPSAYGFNEFDLIFNGPKNLIEVVNFRKTGEPRPDTLQSAPSTSRDSFRPRNVPPAGYEDKVITAFSNFSNPFPDTDLTTLSGRAAAELYRRAVIGGFPDGEFKGDRPVNRAEAAKFLLLARHKTIDEMSNNGQFSDVLDGQWYTKYIVKAAQLGVINGHPDGSFKPGDGVNTAEFLKMLSLTFGIELNLQHDYVDVDQGAWYEQYAGIAQKYDLFPNRAKELRPNDTLSRTDVAIAIYQYLTNCSQ